MGTVFYKPIFLFFCFLSHTIRFVSHQTQEHRLQSIDFLRGFSILFVMLYHSGFYKSLVPMYLRRSWSGVELFFVISGFLVTHFYLKNERVTPKYKLIFTFIVRRLTRVIPVTLISILLCATVYASYHRSHILIHLKQAFFGVLTFSFNIFMVNGHFLQNGPFDYLWSLSIEEQFYLVLPFVFYFIQQNYQRFVLLFSITCIVMFIIRQHVPSEHWQNERLLTHFKMDGLCLGVMLRIILNQYQSKINSALNSKPWITQWILPLLMMISLVLIGVLPGFFVQNNYSTTQAVYNLVSLLCVLALFCALFSSSWIFNCKISQPFLLLGKISFSLYLFHQLPNELLNHFNFVQWLTTLGYHKFVASLFTFLLSSISAIGLAYLFFYYIETFFAQWSVRFSEFLLQNTWHGSKIKERRNSL